MMRFTLPAAVDRLALVGSAMSRKLGRLPKRDAASESIRQVLDLARDLDLPVGLKQLGVPKDDLQSLSETISKELQHLYGLSTYLPRKLTLQNVTALLNAAWEGRIE
jgi:alcohol dehydrogenase class IV